ncbi:MAG TPA: imidazolonepropionase [Labilithrix sp.]|nr:imidazolonepropionase [Labilithrix sp.]
MSVVGIAAKRIVTCDRTLATPDNPLAVIEDAAIIYDASSIHWVGPRQDAPDKTVIVDYGERVVTPGLIDAHTHAAWVGSRHTEYAMRMAGADYRAIADAGGGIVSTYRAVACADVTDIERELQRRLCRMAELGVTTVEVKSGYGLEADGERKQLQAIARARTDASLPCIVATYLALHALPPSAKNSREEYVRACATTMVPEVASEKLAEFVDAYVDEKAFTVDEARLVGEAAKRAGLGIRLHIGQFADVGGAQLCAELGAKSADHLEHIDTSGIEALAKAGTVAALLPVASFTLRQAPPPVGALREAGVALVVASDANPGTAPTESLPLAMALSVPLYGLTPAEAILGATHHAARSLGLAGDGVARPRGSLMPGAHADIVVWDLSHEFAILQPWGAPKTHLVLRDGQPIAGSAHRRTLRLFSATPLR